MLSRLRIFALAVAGCLVRPAFGDNAIATGSNHRQQHYSVDAVQACAVQSFVNGSCSEGDNSEEPGPQFRNSSFSPSTVSFARNISSASWTPPLSTRGRYIVDADGQRFKLRGGNWHGASGTYTGSGNIDDPSNHHAGELAYQTPLALDRVPISKIIDSFLELGINTIRLPFSNQMIHDTTSVPDAGIMANPQFHGMTPLQVFDAVIKALTDANIAVILNNMTIKSIWCCGFDQNARWNEVQTTAQWQADWLFMVNRYKSNQRVVGADLYNEVRRDLLFDPVWGMTSWSQSSQDWYQASLEMGNRILREVNPDILIVIEGINWVGIPVNYAAHGRPNLQPVANLSHTLTNPNKLVYSAHFYAYTGPKNAGSTSGPFQTSDPRYRDMWPDTLASTIEAEAAYVATALNDTQMHYTAPVWISEFGSGGRNDFVLADRSWWANFVQVLIDRDLDFAYWPLVGWQANRTGDGWALMSWDPSGNRMGLFDGDDWRQPAWSSLIAAPASVNGTVEPVAVWRMLSIDSGDAQQSERMAKEGDWSVGNRKASCPDGLRLIGLSYGNNPRALCTDSTVGRGVWDPTNGTFEVVTDEKYVDEKKGDWAKGFMKLQCPPDHFLIGHSFSSSQSNGGLCAAATTDLGLVQESSRTVWFDQSDNMPTSHGEWAPNMTKGACGDTEFAVGYAFKSGKKQKGYPSALLCRTSQTYETAGRISQTGDAGSKCFQFAADGLVLVVFLVVSSAFALSLY